MKAWLLPVLGTLVLLVALPATPAAAASPDDGLTVYLFTAAPGHNEASAWYGHTGIAVLDADAGEDLYYGYRMNVAESRLRAAITATGHATFEMHERSLDKALDEYVQQGREVRLTELDLPGDQRASLVSALKRLAEEEGPLEYDHFQQNCATRLRDVLDERLDGALRSATDSEPAGSLRTLLDPYTSHDAPFAAMMSFVLNDQGDQDVTQWDAMFLPVELERSIAALEVDDGTGPRPLAPSGPVVLAEATVPLAAPAGRALETAFMGLGAVAAGAGIGGGAWARSRNTGHRVVAAMAIAVGLLLALPAALLSAGALGLLGPYFVRNENLLLVSPLAWVLVPVGILAWRGSARAWDLLAMTTGVGFALALFALAMKPASAFDQDNLVFLSLFVPLWAGLAAAVFLVRAGPRGAQGADAPVARA